MANLRLTREDIIFILRNSLPKHTVIGYGDIDGEYYDIRSWYHSLTKMPEPITVQSLSTIYPDINRNVDLDMVAGAYLQNARLNPPDVVYLHNITSRRYPDGHLKSPQYYEGYFNIRVYGGTYARLIGGGDVPYINMDRIITPQEDYFTIVDFTYDNPFFCAGYGVQLDIDTDGNRLEIDCIYTNSLNGLIITNINKRNLNFMPSRRIMMLSRGAENTCIQY